MIGGYCSRKQAKLSPSLDGVRNGVPRTVFGVRTELGRGVTLLKSLECSGVLRPPFSGVSMFDRAMMF